MKTREELKEYFETGDRPTESQFSHLIDSGINQVDDPIKVVSGVVTIGKDPSAVGLKLDTSVEVTGKISGELIFGSKNDHDWHENAVLNRNGFFGIGTSKPVHSFQVGDTINKVVIADASGESFGWSTGYIGFNVAKVNNPNNNTWLLETDTANNGGALIHANAIGDLSFSTIDSSVQRELDQFLTDDEMKSKIRMKIDNSGHVGINQSKPTNLLHISNPSGSGTGLRLEKDAGDGKVLVSDAHGNASWKPKTVVTEGMWEEHIEPDVVLQDKLEKMAVIITNQTVKHVCNGNNGNIGIGTKEPKSKLDVHGDIRLNDQDLYLRGGTDKYHGLGWYGLTSIKSKPFDTISNQIDGPVLFGYGGGALGSSRNQNDGGRKIALSWKETGKVGIGTTNPQYPLQVTSIGTYSNSPSHRVITGNSNSIQPGYGDVQVSIYATGSVWANEFRAQSDARIKDIQGVTNGKFDLITLNKIEITDYTMITDQSEEKRSYKKVIGQQLAEIYPQAVSYGREAVPDIFKSAEVEEGWVLIGANHLVKGDHVRIFIEGNESTVEVVESNEKGFQIEQLKLTSKEVFVYGKIVNDFHVVDYEAISMLNVSATQQIHKEFIELRTKVEKLEKQLQEQNI